MVLFPDNIDIEMCSEERKGGEGMYTNHNIPKDTFFILEHSYFKFKLCR